MRTLKIFKRLRPQLSLAFMLLLLVGTSCETDFTNPNSPTDAQVLNSREGLLALSIGVKQQYSVTGLRFLIETPAITTREGAITTTFQNMIELEEGASALPNFNTNVAGLWMTMLRVVVNADNLIEGAERVELSPATRGAIIAHANTFKAMALGALSQHYEQVIIEPSINNDAAFASRREGFIAAIAALQAARSALPADGIPDDFQSGILQGMNLAETIDAMLARFNLYAGNYAEAIANANEVDLSVRSVFNYDVQNANPVWTRVILNNTPNFKPQDNFGLPAEFDIDDEDGRKEFYLIRLDTTNINGFPIEDLAGFFSTPTSSIPVYLPDEMRLIIAEATVRSNGNAQTAVDQINEVRTGTDDPFDLNANLDDYDGDTDTESLLREIYFQRRLELFLTGQSLEDSRRFGRPEPTRMERVFTDERNRNFYPYPEQERNNNPNTPDDPLI